MKFIEEVQQRFAKAGWYEGRNIKEEFETLPRFDEFPDFLKEFLYEYGGLKVETATKYSKGILDLTKHKSWVKDNALIDDSSYYGGMKTFGIGDYHLDSAYCLCDEQGRVYMISNAPTIMSEDFVEGIEKVIMEDYSNTKEWHFHVKEWKEERF